MAVFVAMLVPSGAHGATPIKACGTLIKTSGAYVVTKNLTVKKGTIGSPCIAVTANYVSLDLGGFTINCGGADVLGIVADNTAGLIVRNGIVIGCDSGLAASGNASGILADGLMTLSNRLPGIGFTRGNAIFRSLSNDNGTGLDIECPSSVIDDTALGNRSDLDFPFGMSGCSVFNVLHE